MSASVTQPNPRISIGVVAATVAGNALEFYDFLVYAIFAIYIGKAFFPAQSEFLSLLTTVGVFWVGFLFRPLGGVLIGAFADRAGRRAALMLTIGLVTIGTMALAFTPSYESIGVAAPVIVILCRIVQGFGLGGEVGPATAFLVEAAPPNQRGFYASWQFASQGLAVLAAGLFGFLLSLALTPQQQADWGWRVPFLICLALVPVAIYLRRAMPETLEQGERALNADRDRLSAHWRTILLAVLLIIGTTVSTYVGNYMTTYAIKTLKMSPSLALSATVLGGVGTTLGALAGGWLADRFGRRWPMLLPRLGLAVLTWPAFLILSRIPNATTLYLTVLLLTVLTGITGAASLVVVPELLPRKVRATGISIAYALGVSIFGGSTQFVITWLIGVTGDPTSPGWYVALTSLVTLGAMLMLPETRGRPLEG